MSTPLNQLTQTVADYAMLIKQGAVLLDVRSAREYENRPLKGFVHIPLDDLAGNMNMLDKTKPIIACCASGARSESAKRILKANGYMQVYNGGGLYNLRIKIGC